MQNLVASESLVAALKSEAGKVDAHMRADLDRLALQLDSRLLEVLDYGLFNGGKRIRPLLVVLAARLCGSGNEGAYRLGCAFEYLHAATLFHDDIIDNSATRRGKASVHLKFGVIEAILAGDFLHAHAMASVAKLSGVQGLDIFCTATTGMVDGEFMQLRNAARHNLSELDYHNAIMGKTGLLIAAACEVGALYGGGGVEERRALRQYGINLGCGFQIVDDLLDYLGDQGKTGKAVGNDLAEGKITLPLIYTLNSAGKGDRARLLQIINDAALRIQGVDEVCALIDKYGGFAAARNRAEDAVAEGVAGLAIFTRDDVQGDRALLEGLARYVLTRQK